MSVRILTTLGSGDLVCIVLAVEQDGNKTALDLGPYVGGGAFGMIAFANTEDNCIKAVYTTFVEYLPYIMLLQTLVLVIAEKFTFRIPRIAQRVERFYKNIVEESLFGKDPDVAEDMYDSTTSTEAISRRRQRNEICVTLKRSSFIHHIYISKNILEIMLVLMYLPININYALMEFDVEALCEVNVQSIPGIIDKPGIIHFQCQGKKMNFFSIALWAHIILLALHAILSFAAILWCLYGRPVTNLLNTIEAMRKEGESNSVRRLRDASGEDFLFLFDLLSHSCGLESTLRVLTHSDETFYEICKPNIDMTDKLEVEEDKLKVIFGPSDIERWLQAGKNKASRSTRSILIDSYEVTIFPAESVYHTHNIPALTSLGTPTGTLQKHSAALDAEMKSTNLYQTWFFDLNGGRTEYVVTIACMIGKSRMKGEKVVSNLRPYGAEKPRTGMVKSSLTHSVEIFWDPPKGEFTKYVLSVDKLSDKSIVKPSSLLRVSSGVSRSSRADLDTSAEVDHEELTRPNIRVMDLSHKLTEYALLGLEPGEKYRIELSTKTGSVSTRQPIDDIVLTCPLPPRGLRVSEVSSTSCLVSWLLPESHHSCLRGFQIQIRLSDGRIFKDVAVTKTAKSFNVKGLQQCQDYDIAVTALCMAENGRRTESEVALVNLTTLPEKVKNLRLDQSTPNSITVKWDTPMIALNLKYKVTISGDTGTDEDEEDTYDLDDEDVKSEHHESSSNLGQANIRYYTTTVEVAGDKTQHTFSKLPEIIGSGHAFDVTIIASVVTSRENEVLSPDVTERFMTKPLAPTNLRLGNKENLQICWNRSMTSTVTSYKVRWKPIASQVGSEEEIKAEEAIVPFTHTDAPGEVSTVHFDFPLAHAQVGIGYKVNVYAVAESAGFTTESKELHEKFIIKSPTEIDVFVEEEKKT